MNRKNGMPKSRGMAGLALAHVVCCGGILLFATGALSGVGAWLAGGGLPWVALALALALVLGVGGGVLLWRRQRGRPAGCVLDETGPAGYNEDMERK